MQFTAENKSDNHQVLICTWAKTVKRKKKIENATNNIEKDKNRKVIEYLNI